MSAKDELINNFITVKQSHIPAYKVFYFLAQKQCREAQHRPEKAVERANLTVQVQRHLRIVPHLKTKLHINKHTYNKLRRCDDKTAQQAFYYHITALKHSENLVQHQEAYTSRGEHCPMSIASPQNFDKSVARRSYDKHKKLLHTNHLRQK